MIFNSTTAATRDMQIKRVCMIAYTTYTMDGRVRLEAESLVNWGYEVTILVPKEEAAPKTYVLEGVTIQELNVRKIRDNNKFRYVLSYVMFLAVGFVACTRLFLRSRIQVIHVHNMPDVLVFAAVVPCLMGCKLVLDLHDTVPETYEAKFGKISPVLRWCLRLEEKVCCSMADRVICVNHVQREAVIGRGVPADKIATVITMPRFASSSEPIPKTERKQGFRMVNHGTISKRLGNDLILEAAAKLVNEIPGFELHIIGDGENLNQLQSMARSLGLEKAVYFHAAVPWDKLAEKLRIMDVGIVANRVNIATKLMLPSKLIDYTVLGIPAIVPRLKGVEYYFSDEMVSYFEPENVDSMVAATLGLYRDGERMERQARKAKKFLDENGWDVNSNGLRGLYDRLLNDRWKPDLVRDKPDLKTPSDRIATQDGAKGEVKGV
jgi:glycosyltransferase involved in cell wall biosynthesis